MSAPSPIELREIALEAAREAGALALEHYNEDIEAWEKGDKTPVTKTDLAVDELLRNRLTQTCPGFGWLSEETKDDPVRLGLEDVWIVDPIDGTRAFVKGKPEWVISIAAVRQGRPIAATIFNPSTDEMFDAVKDGGARLNGAPIHPSNQQELEGCRLLAYQDMINHADWPRPWPAMHLEQRNAVAYRIALVAAGKFDATLSLSLKSEWDLAAGVLIAQEAGAKITNHQGGELTFNHPEGHGHNLICAGPILHKAILDRVSFISLERIVGGSSN